MIQSLLSFFCEDKTYPILRKLSKAIDENNEREFLKYLKELNRFDISEKNQEFLFRISIMSSNNSFFLEQLLIHGLNPNLKDDDGIFPIHRAVESGILDNVKILLEYRADPNSVDMRGVTPLHIAYSYDKMNEIITTLIEFGANLHIRDSLGKRYLM